VNGPQRSAAKLTAFLSRRLAGNPIQKRKRSLRHGQSNSVAAVFVNRPALTQVHEKLLRSAATFHEAVTLSSVIPSEAESLKNLRFRGHSPRTIALPFVIPSEAEGSAVPRTSPGNVESRPATNLSSRLPRRAVGPERSGVERSRSLFICGSHLRRWHMRHTRINWLAVLNVNTRGVIRLPINRLGRRF
jgi:hypothetical protein